MLRSLSILEARVVAVLVEKAHTVPDSYPLSLNTLVLGCNQKTARDPVMQASDAEVQAALDEVLALHLVSQGSGSRVKRYEHNMARGLGLPSQSVALLATLVLRGPQTAAELRANAERLYRFADLSSVDGFLQELAEREQEKGGALVVKLPRSPGSREARWAHLLCGTSDAGSASIDNGEDFVALSELAVFKAQQAALQDQVHQLRALVERLYDELGVSRG